MTIITLTGADENTPIWALCCLASLHPRLEVGLLYTANPEGRRRYPGRAWLQEATAALSGRCALHVCGSTARRELLDGELADLTVHAHRVQLNGVLSCEEVAAAAGMVETLITQHNLQNVGLASLAIENHALLLDASGGRGLRPESWFSSPISPSVSPSVSHSGGLLKPIGYAGGLGPDDLLVQLPLISAAAGNGWDDGWIDMENRLRTDDWFDLGKAKVCAEIFAGFMESGCPSSERRSHPSCRGRSGVSRKQALP